MCILQHLNAFMRAVSRFYDTGGGGNPVVGQPAVVF